MKRIYKQNDDIIIPNSADLAVESKGNKTDVNYENEDSTEKSAENKTKQTKIAAAATVSLNFTGVIADSQSGNNNDQETKEITKNNSTIGSISMNKIANSFEILIKTLTQAKYSRI